jgi:hypothetical protein
MAKGDKGQGLLEGEELLAPLQMAHAGGMHVRDPALPQTAAHCTAAHVSYDDPARRLGWQPSGCDARGCS